MAKLEQREKLWKCYQNSKSVQEYVYELTKLWNMIGDVDERQKVIQLWTGLNGDLQKGLWTKELHPGMLFLAEVQGTAELLEIANAKVKKEKGHGTQNWGNTSGQMSQKNNSKDRNSAHQPTWSKEVGPLNRKNTKLSQTTGAKKDYQKKLTPEE
ncbi:hypothetical protein SERLA73DRAFT_155185 [Serpula lacrymans var. lacrymans S7.3]|uniref:Uncharacterized protein n=1 Tax=Serpula lacrymans var. lacrymans (strain S7.3) TaxID=936435 RepID=F8Q8S3_SERL3|nr:hypothetical protein SERLA73DRAFT_155185 [Serpula lacrymans var. lacrymans S7.3]